MSRSGALDGNTTDTSNYTTQQMRGKYNYYEMKRSNMQDSQYVQQSDRLETESEVSKPKYVTSGNKSTIGRLFVLDLSSGECRRFRPEGNRIGVPTPRWDSSRC